MVVMTMRMRNNKVMMIMRVVRIGNNGGLMVVCDATHIVLI